MPSRNLTFRQADSAVMIAPARGPINANPNVFDKSFNEGFGLEEWDNWMRWEGATTEMLPASIEGSESTASSTSSPDTWIMGLDTSGVNMMTTSYTARSEFPFEDAPFEVDETPATSLGSASNHGLPTYPPPATFPAQNQRRDLHKSYPGFSSLTEAEERSLQEIAMPYHALSNIKIASAPQSPMESHTSASPSPSPEPEARTRKSKKRKSVDLGEPSNSTLCLSRKRGHNAIEKRYRTNLNAKIECLREGVPAPVDSNANPGEEDSDVEDSKSSQQKYGKAAILTRALEYIQFLEGTTQRLCGEVDTLKTRVGAFEKLAMSGSIILNGNGMDVLSRPVMTKSETLETIQYDFQQIKPKIKAPTTPAPRRRGSK